MNQLEELKAKCYDCGLTINLQVHHISYEPVVKILLCVPCHLKRHKTHGVGVANWEKKPIPEDYPQSWKKLSYAQIMKKYGISYATVHKWAIKSKLYRKTPIKNIKIIFTSAELVKMETTSTYTQRVKSQGRNCIPKIVREALGISEGDFVTFKVQKTVTLKEIK